VWQGKRLGVVRAVAGTIGRKGRLALALGAVAALGAMAAPAQAGTCGTRSSKQALTSFNDYAYYFLAPGGGFEGGLGGWTGSAGIASVPGNEPWNVFGGSSSLLVPANGRAQSANFCVAPDEGILRLFVKRPGVPYAKLHVMVSAIQPQSGQWVQSWLDVEGATPGWTLSAPLPIPPAFGTSLSEQINVTISDNGAPAAWQVDDVAIDPVKGN
jgi:hypothetical protein